MSIGAMEVGGIRSSSHRGRPGAWVDRVCPIACGYGNLPGDEFTELCLALELMLKSGVTFTLLCTYMVSLSMLHYPGLGAG